MFSWRINFWDVSFLGTPPLECLIYTKKKNFKKKLIYFRAVFVDFMRYPTEPGADAFHCVDNIIVIEMNLNVNQINYGLMKKVNFTITLWKNG